MNHSLSKIFPVLLIILFNSNALFSQNSKVQLTGIYSDFQYGEESGDVSGMEVFIVYTNDWYYAIVQSAEGSPTVPTITKVKVKKLKTETEVEFSLSGNEGYTGIFKGKITDWGLSGTLSSGQTSASGETIFKLKRGKSYWQ